MRIRVALRPDSPYPLPMFYGWVILGVATVATLATSPGQSYLVGKFNAEIQAALGIDETTLTAAYGIATFAATSDEAPSARVTASGIMVGTPSYVSPEQIGGEELDARADLYSFGVLFYEMITGTLPFYDPERPLRVLQMHMTEMPKRPSKVAEQEVPAWLDDTVMHLLAKYPDDRPESAEAVSRVLEDPSSAKPLPKGTNRPITRDAAPMAHGGSSNRTLIVVIAVAFLFVVLALLGGVGIGLFMSGAIG